MSYSIAIALALGAALLHTVWNVLLKTSGDPLQVSARAVGSSMLLATPVAFVAWLTTGRPGLPLEGWLLAGLSGLLELGYFVFLSEAYRRGDLSAVYPLARGTAPLLAVAAGILLLGERLGAAEGVGVLCLLAGIWLVRRPVAAGAAVVPALLTGITIASYSTVDSAGVRLAAPWLYAWVLDVWTAVLLAVLVWRVGDRSWLGNRGPAGPTAPTSWPRAATVGVLMTCSYLMVLFALSVAPLAVVAPLRESAVVLVTGWGVWKLRERQGTWLRIGGAAAILAGVALLAVG